MSLERVNLNKKNSFELKNISFQLKKNHQKSRPKIMNTGVDLLQREWSLLRPQIRAYLLPQIRDTYIVLCFTESKQAICSHRIICKQRTIDLSSQPKYMPFLVSPAPLTIHLTFESVNAQITSNQISWIASCVMRWLNCEAY